MSTRWDPVQYARFADHRGRPFRDLLARVGAEDPGLVVDLGCGNGPLTMTLGERWPAARVVGVDSSAQMLESARAGDPDGRVEWVQADLATWDISALGERPGVVVTNATLQWVPNHRGLLPSWVAALESGGWFAMQVPSNFNAPSHQLMRDVAERHPAADRLRPGLARLGVAEPADYLDDLSALGCDVDAWETTYQHILDPEGEQANPVLEWVRGTGLRPVLDALTDEGEREAFLEEYDARLRAAYPRRPFGVLLPFRRVFAVAHKHEIS